MDGSALLNLTVARPPEDYGVAVFGDYYDESGSELTPVLKIWAAMRPEESAMMIGTEDGAELSRKVSAKDEAKFAGVLATVRFSEPTRPRCRGRTTVNLVPIKLVTATG